jgi:hypothetical protein
VGWWCQPERRQHLPHWIHGVSPFPWNHHSWTLLTPPSVYISLLKMVTLLLVLHVTISTTCLVAATSDKNLFAVILDRMLYFCIFKMSFYSENLWLSIEPALFWSVPTWLSFPETSTLSNIKKPVSLGSWALLQWSNRLHWPLDQCLSE